jgi:hypothetical protein
VAAPLAAYLLAQRPVRRDVATGVVVGAVACLLLAGPGDPFVAIERGWLALLCGAVAVLMTLRPGRAFVPTALSALGLAAAAAALVVAVTPLSWGEVAWRVTQHFGYQARQVMGAMVQAAEATGGEAPGVVTALERSVAMGIRLASGVFPALLLLQSFAALALAWGMYRRLAREPLGEPVGALRDFRFDDNLVWGIVLALVALLVPRPTWLGALGGNLAVFFGGLYAVRGVAVASALAAAAGIRGWGAVLGGSVLVLFLAPVVAMAALALGVTDTWVDWRARLARSAGAR